MESGRKPRRLEIELEASAKLFTSNGSDKFNGARSSTLPRAATSFSCCDDFFLLDNDSLLAMLRKVRGEDVDSLFVMSLSASENIGVVGVTGDLDKIIQHKLNFPDS